MLKVTLNKHQQFTEKEIFKLANALNVLQIVVNSQEFKTRVLSFTYRGEFRFFETNLSNVRVYDMFMSGRQYNEQTDDYEMDIDLTIYHSRWSSTVGYTYPNTVRTWINRKFFSRFGLAEICGNVAHEYCHKIGFEHSFHPTPSRPFSVPYGIGNLVEELAEKYLKNGELV